MNIGLVGLGSMGLNLAKNLISKGFIVNAFEKNKRIIDDISLPVSYTHLTLPTTD